VANGTLTVRTTNGEGTPAAIPVKDAAVIVDSATLDKQLHHEPGFFTGWNGAGDGGSDGGERDAGSVCGIGKHRAGQGDPDVAWLDTRKPHLGGFQRIVRQD